MEPGRRGEPDGRVPLHPRGVSGDAQPGSAGWAHHQQRLDLRALAATAVDRVHRDEACDHRTDQVDGPRRAAFDIACGQIDIGNAATDMASGAATGAAQADGSIRPEPLMDVGEVGRAVRYMASLPLDANVASLMVLPPKMPFIGRG